jgi:putative peptide zinc metalloprotease protein
VNPKLKTTVQFFSMGGGLYHVYDAQTNRHFKLGEQEVAWLRMLDGERSKEDLRGDIPEEYFDPFFAQLGRMGLLEGSEAKRELDLFKLKVRTLSPNDVLNRLAKFSVYYRRALNVTFPVLLLLNVLLLPTAWMNIQKSLQSVQFGPWPVVAYLAAMLLIGFVHESSHALVAKSHGVNVPAMGFMLLLFHPAFYADVSGMSMLKKSRPRINIMLAGIMANNWLVTIAFGLYFLVQGTPAAMYVLAFIWLNVMLMFINIVPFVQYDGHYILLELVGEPNFVANARRSLLERNVPKKFEYTAYALFSYAFALIMLLVAVIRLRTLTIRYLTDAMYVNYACVALMILTTVFYTRKFARKKA